MQSAIEYIHKELQNLYPETEISSFCNLIFQKITGLSRTQLIINKNTLFSDEQHHIVESFIENLKKYVPIQYIIGETDFYELTFKVNHSVLIPRPETEELVDKIRLENDKNAELNILDIGTGSGCIAISLKHIFKNSTIDGFDVSEAALETAQSNSKYNNLDVNFSKVDILNPPLIDKKWDIIVSNPPYVLETEKSGMLSNVLEYEPHLALFVPDNDPLLFYRHIACFAKQHLRPDGKLYFEINRNFGESTIELLSEMKFEELILFKDISGNDRMIRAKLMPDLLTDDNNPV